MNKCTISYDDVAFWAEYATHNHKFVVVKKQCEKLMGAATKKPQPDQINEFNKRYRISWNLDDSFDLMPI